MYFGFIVTRETALPIQIVLRFCAGGVVDAKSYFAVAKILCARPSWATDLSPDLTTCDTETSEPDHSPSGSRPQGWNNRVRPSPALRLNHFRRATALIGVRDLVARGYFNPGGIV